MRACTPVHADFYTHVDSRIYTRVDAHADARVDTAIGEGAERPVTRHPSSAVTVDDDERRATLDVSPEVCVAEVAQRVS